MDSTTSNLYLRRPNLGLSMTRYAPLAKDYRQQRRSVAIYDSNYVEVRHTLMVGETHIIEPMIQPLDAYVRDRMAGELRKEMMTKRLASYKSAGKTTSGEGVAIDLPYRIKSKTFRRLFGGDNVGVRVSGNIQINGSLRKQKFDQIQSSTQQNTNTSFRIDMVQQFTITGKVGQKVEVKVDQDSERLFDFENSLKLTYTGDPDEIVQKVEAGNVNLQLGTKLATFSGKNTGLFGLKTQLKVGALDLTGIASIERGQKNRQTPNLSSQRTTFNEKSFIANQYYWITACNFTNTAVEGATQTPIPNYRQNYRFFLNRQHVAVPPQWEISDIELFVESLTNTDQGRINSTRAAAIQYYDDLFDPTFPTDANHVTASWKPLDKSLLQYDWYSNLGYIRLKQPLAQGQMLACAFTLRGTGTDTLQFGSMTAADTLADGTRYFVLLGGDDPSPTDSTWNLMFRHAYSLQAQNLRPEDFKLTISRNAATVGQQEETDAPGQNKSYLQWYQFDLQGEGGASGPDDKVDNLGAVIDFNNGVLQFLDLRPFDPEGYWNEGAPPLDADGNPQTAPTKYWDFAALETAVGDTSVFRNRDLYDKKYSQSQVGGNKWRFSSEFKGSSSVFDLGPLVLESSEEITLNGNKLQRGTDYTIDYLSGQLKILNEAAKAPGANLEITYESGRVFQLDKTTLLGARAEYGLWEDSYVGGMFLYLNQKSLDRRVRIGNEPIRNSLWDVNTDLKFHPNFLTRIVDAMPLVSTTAASEFAVDGEVAKVFPNPNSLENHATGDLNGLAYIDDFEGSRRAVPLGLQRRSWSVSSLPAPDMMIRKNMDYYRGRLKWWNPNTRDQVGVREVFPEREINSQVANTLQSLILEFTPDDSAPDPRQSWGGVMRYLGEGYADQSRSQYLEFWLKLPPSSQQDGKLIVDLGTISEDALPNDTLNTEDHRMPGYESYGPLGEYGNGVLEPGSEDTGIDGVFSSDPQDVAAWNGYGTDRAGNPRPIIPSWDDWSHASGSSDFAKVNGTENNRDDEAGGYPDTEDLNNNDNLDRTNSYYSYTIELRDGSPFIAGGNYENSWRLFRIPINEQLSGVRDSTGGADLTSVRWARLILTGFSSPVLLETVQMDIVSNEWLPQFAANDSTEYVKPAVLNTHENPGYEPPPGVQGEIDPITNLRQREQSLVLKINHVDNLAGGAPNEFFVAKNLYQDYNLLEYKHLKMFVHGGAIPAEQLQPFTNDKYDVILRLGQNYYDIDNSYYEIIRPVKSGWDAANAIDVMLNDLALLHPHRASAGLPVTARYAEMADSTQPGDSIAIKGSPTMGRIGFIAVGVRLNPKYVHGRDEEIWVDELRMSDIYKDPGQAAAVNSSLNFADLILLNGGFQTTDADFHNVNTRINPSQSSSNSWRGNATINMHKAYVENWGFQLPLTMAYTETNTIPRVIPGTDTRINPAQAPDSIKGHQQQFSYQVRYSKRAMSKNPLVAWTLEKLSAGWDYSRTDRNDYTVLKNRQEQTGAQASYSLPTSKGRGVRPLWFLKPVPYLRLIGNPTLYYKPTKFQTAATVTRGTTLTMNRPQYTVNNNNPDSVIVNQRITNTVSFLSSRSFSLGFQPTDPIILDLSRAYKGQLDSTKNWGSIFSGDFGRMTEITQNATANYTPEFAKWLKPTFAYTSGYTWSNRNFSQANAQNVSNQRNFGVDYQLDVRSILGGGGGRERSRNNPRQVQHPAETPGDSTGTPAPAPADTTAPRERRSIFAGLGSALSPVKKAFLTLDPIALSYDNNVGHTQTGTLGQASLPYQFGLTQSPGLDTASGTISVPTRRKSEDITARTGMRPVSTFRLGYTYALRKSESISQLPTGSVEQSVIWIGKDTDKTAIPFPDVTADWSGLEKIAFLSKVARSVSISSALSQKVRESWSQTKSNITSREYTRSWQPLVGVTFGWKGDIESSVRFNTSKTFTNGVAQGNRRVTTNQTITATVSYTMRTGFKLPLPLMHDLHLQNQTTFSLNGDFRTDKDESASRPGAPYAQTAANSQWSLQPRITYSFSSTVQGQAYVQMQNTKNNITGAKTRLFEFGINVNIAIRG